MRDRLHTFFRTPSRTRSRIAGTAAIIVGANIPASPFVPFFILFDVSVRVKGDPYPIEHPTATTIFYNIHKLLNHSDKQLLSCACVRVRVREGET